MANSLVVRKGTDLAKRIKALRAAQYVRMSTDHQRYSIQNQAAVIATYAQERHFTIVGTYVDEGRSGLRIKNRAGLIELIDDIESGRADFDHVLVYDVSRWGRFQDIDESAHYEFICRKNGVSVEYCAEQFENDGSLLSSIIKNIKRVMAAEYSRELSVKVHAGQCRIASLGYRVGGPLNFALRRELIGENLLSKGHLSKGQHKALQTDRVRLQLGSDEETDIVRRIFRLFVDEGRSGADVARQLNKQKVGNHHGRLWTERMILTILRNENYIGNIVHNRVCQRLGQRRTSNPREQWVRREGIIAPIIDRNLFARAQELLDNRYISISEEQMLVRLRTTLAKKGKLNTRIVDNTPGLPSAASYCEHFGSLRKAYRLIGYTGTRDGDWIDSRQHWSKILMEHATLIGRALEIGLPQNDGKNCLRLRLGRKTSLTLMVARQSRRPGQWRAYREQQPSQGLLALLRLDRPNKAIWDYVLMPVPAIRKHYLFLSDASLGRLNALRLQTANGLVREIKRRHRRLRC